MTGNFVIEVEVFDPNGASTIDSLTVVQEFNYQDEDHADEQIARVGITPTSINVDGPYTTVVFDDARYDLTYTVNKEIDEYISTGSLAPIAVTDLGQGRFVIEAQSEWPGRFPLHLTATDTRGNTTSLRVPVEVYWAQQPFDVRGVMIDGWHPDGTSQLTDEDFETLMDRLVDDNVNFVSINPLWYLVSPQANQFIRMPQVWEPGTPTMSISDQQVVQLVQLAHNRDIGVMLKPMVFVSDWSYIGDVDMGNPAVWLRNYADQVLLPMAAIAADNDVEMLSLFNDPGIQNRHRSLWIEIISELRGAYSGDLSVADPRFPSVYRKNNEVLFGDYLDVYGFQAYLPGSGYPEFPNIPGTADPTVDHMRSNISAHFDGREQEVVSLGIAAVATEFGLINYDGANLFPAKTFFGRGIPGN